jgi:hypothetical protein
MSRNQLNNPDISLSSFSISEPGQGVLTIGAHVLLQLADLGQCWVLTARSQQVSQGVQLHASIATLVEKCECLLVVGASLRIVSLMSAVHIRWFCSRDAVTIKGENNRKKDMRQREHKMLLGVSKSRPVGVVMLVMM